MDTNKIVLKPIAFVRSERAAIRDDDWGDEVSEVVLADELATECFDGIDAFSHLEVIFHFNQVKAEKIVWGAAHPRGNPDWPKVGIFSQRKKSRPNLIGLTTVVLLERNGRVLKVQGLDAIDGTPVLDIKPCMREFLPKGEVRQADWATELMLGYW